MDEMKHEDKMEMHKGHHHPHPWQKSWKSPVSLGIFFLTTALAIAILLYTVLNVIGAVAEAMHPASQGLSAQDMQQLEQQMPAQTGSATGAAAQ